MRVLIVDDELFIRGGLRTLIDWQEAGFDEVMDAKNAMEAINIIERARPDLILTDIFMPEMSGLDFAKKIRVQYPSIRFVILTGYEKFEYAREAIEIGVAKYLVKPVFPDELKETVDELVQEMTLERRNLNWSEMAQKRLNEYKPIIIEKFWGDVLAGVLTDPAEMRRRAAAADIPPTGNELRCLAVEIRGLEKVYERYGASELPLVRFAIRNMLEELHAGAITYIYDYSEAVLLCLLSEPAETDDWKATAEAIECTLKIDVGIGIGRTVGDFSVIRSSALETLDSVKYLAMLEQTGVMRYEDIPAWKKDHVEYPYEEEKNLLELLRYRDRIGEQAMDAFIHQTMSQNPSPNMNRLVFVQLLGAVYRLADEYGIESIPAFHQSVSRLEESPSYGQVRKLFLELFKEIAARRSSRHTGFVSQLVEGAKQIIDGRYGDPDLSVASIAQTLCISPNYLSRIFHRQTGKTCVEHMTERRLEEAAKLLRLTTLKNYEIAEQVGYANAHYFSSMFKKNIGCSPSEFRERAGERQEHS